MGANRVINREKMRIIFTLALVCLQSALSSPLNQVLLEDEWGKTPSEPDYDDEKDGIHCPTKRLYEESKNGEMCYCSSGSALTRKASDTNDETDQCGAASWDDSAFIGPIKSAFNKYVVGPAFAECCNQHDIDVGMCPIANSKTEANIKGASTRPRNKLDADRAFLQCMKNHCSKRWSGWWWLQYSCNWAAEGLYRVLDMKVAVNAYSASIRTNCECRKR